MDINSKHLSVDNQMTMTSCNMSLDTETMVRMRPVRPVSAHSRVTSSLCRLELPDWYRYNRSVSTPSTPCWRRQSRSRDASWRRGGTQSETGESQMVRSAVSSRDSSTVRGQQQRWSVYKDSSDHRGHRWSMYKDCPDPAAMTSSCISCHSEATRDSCDNNCSVPMSTIKSTNSYLSYRQPYMGWRSLERLKLSGSCLLSPDQRLAASLLNQGQQCLVKLAAAADK